MSNNEDVGNCEYCGALLTMEDIYLVTPHDFSKVCKDHRAFARVFQQDIVRACLMVDPAINTIDEVNRMRFENKKPYQDALKDIWFLPRCECCGQRKPHYK